MTACSTERTRYSGLNEASFWLKADDPAAASVCPVLDLKADIPVKGHERTLRVDSSR